MNVALPDQDGLWDDLGARLHKHLATVKRHGVDSHLNVDEICVPSRVDPKMEPPDKSPYICV
jgi:hypothetical protein